MKENEDPEQVLKNIAEENSINISSITPLGGGDINEVSLITSKQEKKFVLKVNDAKTLPGMFPAEKQGLEALFKTSCIRIPKVISTGISEDKAYLLLEYIPHGKQGGDFWETFGEQLACLHKNTADKFGFEIDNFIGNLPQKNTWESSAGRFYVNQRLRPQLEMAEKQNFKLGISSDFLENIEDNIPDEAPALVHGDLWSGNFIISSKGEPCLIDPSVSYAPREMDLAMMKLFGGFDRKLFYVYEEEFPLERGFEERVPLWQLYYLLVHLNIFGAGYRNQVMNIIRKYN